MENNPTPSEPGSDFCFADHLVLDDSPTRAFYKNLLQGLIHKNNNTLGVIQGFATLISMEDGLDEEMKENIEHMRQSITASSELAKVILTAGGCANVETEPVDISVMLPYITQTSQAICEKAGATLQVNQEGSLPLILADTSRFQELIRELIKNAAEATVESGQREVVIDILPPGSLSPSETNRVDIFVRNTCKDIEPGNLGKVFHPFHTTKDNRHYGIGLTTAGVLAGQMNMRLGLRSSEGTTTAWLSIPIAPSS